MRLDAEFDRKERLKRGLAKITKKGKYKEKKKGIRLRPFVGS